jgi:hypothetical protein
MLFENGFQLVRRHGISVKREQEKPPVIPAQAALAETEIKRNLSDKLPIYSEIF